MYCHADWHSPNFNLPINSPDCTNVSSDSGDLRFCLSNEPPSEIKAAHLCTVLAVCMDIDSQFLGEFLGRCSPLSQPDPPKFILLSLINSPNTLFCHTL